MPRKVTTTINPDLCKGCKTCLSVCVNEVIEMVDGKAVVTGEDSLGCDHCRAVCPEGAIEVGFVDDATLKFNTFDVINDWMPHGGASITELARLMQSRRSCRNYKDEPISKEVLEDLVKIAITAPSGTNCQMWEFTIIPNRESVKDFGESILKFFKRLNVLADKKVVRGFSKLFMKDALGFYYREYYETVKDAIVEYYKTGKDRLFYKAPAVIIISADKEASCPKEDALMAAQNILLGAHAMGLGTCMIGFAVEAMQNDKSLYKKAGIPANEKVYAVITVGKPKEKYKRTCARRLVTPRYFEV